MAAKGNGDDGNMGMERVEAWQHKCLYTLFCALFSRLNFTCGSFDWIGNNDFILPLITK